MLEHFCKDPGRWMKLEREYIQVIWHAFFENSKRQPKSQSSKKEFIERDNTSIITTENSFTLINMGNHLVRGWTHLYLGFLYFIWINICQNNTYYLKINLGIKFRIWRLNQNIMPMFYHVFPTVTWKRTSVKNWIIVPTT